MNILLRNVPNIHGVHHIRNNQKEYLLDLMEIMKDTNLKLDTQCMFNIKDLREFKHYTNK